MNDGDRRRVARPSLPYPHAPHRRGPRCDPPTGLPAPVSAAPVGAALVSAALVSAWPGQRMPRSAHAHGGEQREKHSGDGCHAVTGGDEGGQVPSGLPGDLGRIAGHVRHDVVHEPADEYVVGERAS